MLVSGTYLTTVRMERMDQLTSPQITVNTTSTYQTLRLESPGSHVPGSFALGGNYNGAHGRWPREPRPQTRTERGLAAATVVLP